LLNREGGNKSGIGKNYNKMIFYVCYSVNHLKSNNFNVLVAFSKLNKFLVTEYDKMGGKFPWTPNNKGSDYPYIFYHLIECICSDLHLQFDSTIISCQSLFPINILLLVFVDLLHMDSVLESLQSGKDLTDLDEILTSKFLGYNLHCNVTQL
jgi:hypothetical protein